MVKRRANIAVRALFAQRRDIVCSRCLTTRPFWLIIFLFFCSCGDNDSPADEKTGGKRDYGVRDFFLPDRALSADKGKDSSESTPGDIDTSKLEWVEMKYKPAPQKLNGVWGNSPTDLYGVGPYGVIMHYDGQEWSPMPSGTADDIYGIWGRSSGEIYAVSTFAALRYNGKEWTKIKNVWSSFTAIGGLKDTGPWIVSGYDSSNIIWEPIEDDVWRIIAPQRRDHKFKIFAIWPYTKDEIYVAGEGGKVLKIQYRGHTLYFCWAGVFELRGLYFSLLPPTGVNRTLRGLWGTSPENIYAVGDDGVILHFDGSGWKKIEISDSYFYGVWGSSRSDVYVVGHPIFKSDESIFHFDGKNWKRVPPFKPTNLNAIFGFSDKEIFTVGNQGSWKKNN